MMRKTTILCIMLLILTCTGCTKITSSSVEDGYNTEYAMSTVEYTIFLNKQIAVAENVLLTRVTMAKDVSEGIYDISQEIENTEEGISKIEAVEDEVTMTMPAVSYETDREDVLNLLEDGKLALEDYLDALQNGNLSDLETYAASIKSCYLALSGEGNTYYQ